MAPLVKKVFVKRLWSKLKNKENDTTERIPENECVVDSEPDYFYESKSEENSALPPRNDQWKNLNDDENSDKQSAYEADEEFNEEKEKRKPSKTEGGENQQSGPITNVHIHDVGNVHVGPAITYNFGQASKKKTKAKKSLPTEITAISLNKLDSDHIELLSDHFGNMWRKIGLLLELSNGQLDRIENNCEKDVKKASIEVMTLWMRMNGEKATVGRLCDKLWNSSIVQAKEAVQKLAENVENFN